MLACDGACLSRHLHSEDLVLGGGEGGGVWVNHRAVRFLKSSHFMVEWCKNRLW